MVLLERIGSGLIEDDLRSLRPYGLESFRESAIEFLVAGPVVEPDVEIAPLLDGIEMLLVDREGEHRRIVAEQMGGAVPLMEVAVHYRGPRDPAFTLQDANGDRQIVDVAEARRLRGERVVEATAEIDAGPAAQCFARRESGPARRENVGAHDLVRERQLRAGGAGRPAQVLEILEVLGGVNQQQVLARRGRGREDVLLAQVTALHQRASHRREFLHGKDVGADVALIGLRVHDRGTLRHAAHGATASGERAKSCPLPTWLG